jgi:anti-sigma B factor antagonist
MVKIDKNEQYALLIPDSTTIDNNIVPEIEKKISGLIREGYCNFIFDFKEVEKINPEGIALLRKVEKICRSENGIVVITTEKDDLIVQLDSAKIVDLAIMNTNEEAAEAVFLNELENDFRDEEEENEAEYDNNSNDFE